MFPVNTHYWFSLVHTHSPGSLIGLQDFFWSYLDPLHTDILVRFVQLEFSRCSFRVLHLFIGFSVPEALGTMIQDSFFVPMVWSWRLLLWCFFSWAQNRSWLWLPCCSFEMPLKCCQDIQIWELFKCDTLLVHLFCCYLPVGCYVFISCGLPVHFL